MNRLERIDEFREVLKDYWPSSDAIEALAPPLRLVLLVGPSSSGRNTIINELLKSGDYHFVVSDTTRKMRVNNGVPEQNGREYWFRTEEEMLDDLRAGKFLEAAIIHEQQVSGISIRELQSAAQAHKIAINEIEVVGADHIHQASPTALFLFILPPSFDEWMARMNARGTLPQDEIVRRLESTVNEITVALDRDYYTFVVNDTFMHTARHIDAIIKQKADTEEDQAAAKTVAHELLAATQQYLSECAD